MSDRFAVADDGTRLYSRSDGDSEAPPLLLCNSLGTTLATWDLTADSWSRSRRVIRFDQRGHGRSDAPAGPYDLARLGRDAVAVLDAWEVPQADVCGISLGGQVALWLAAHEPDRVARIVLADTAARVGSPEAWQERATLVRAGGMGAVVELVMERFFSHAFRSRAEPVLEQARDQLLSTAVEGYAASCEALAIADLRDEAGRVVASALVVVGTEDEATPPDQARDLDGLLPDSVLVTLEGAGHLSHLEQPDRFARLVDGFMAGLTASEIR